MAPDYRILVGDVREMLASLPAGSVHACITSPPYFGLRDYGLPPVEWPAVAYAPMAGLPPVTVPAMACCLGLEPDPMAFVGHLVQVYREVWRVLRDDGTCWLNLGDSYSQIATARGQTYQRHSAVRSAGWEGTALEKREIGRELVAPKENTPGLKPKDLLMIPARAALALQADGWFLRNDIIWAKPNPMPESVTDRCTTAHEHIYLLAKSARYFFDADAIREPGVVKTEEEHAARLGKLPHRQAGIAGQDGRRALGLNSCTFNPAGRNKRSVWEVATRGNPQAHFACWPEELVRPMVRASTSQTGCCAECGAPWERVVERMDEPDPSAKGSYFDKGKTGAREGGDRTQAGERFVKRATGWRPTCACDAGTVPATVLDIFAGSGTTGRVALQEGRRFVGIDANPEYAEMARQNCETYYKPIPRPAREAEEQPVLFTPPAGG